MAGIQMVSAIFFYIECQIISVIRCHFAFFFVILRPIFCDNNKN